LAWDDPVVWILFVGLLVLFFGSGKKIPEIARTIGRARREIEVGLRGIPPGISQNLTGNVTGTSQDLSPADPKDPLVIAAQREGIETAGKSRDQIATELAWKLNKK
jgi:sec-independent protein translocase protein TatA